MDGSWTARRRSMDGSWTARRRSMDGPSTEHGRPIDGPVNGLYLRATIGGPFMVALRVDPMAGTDRASIPTRPETGRVSHQPARDPGGFQDCPGGFRYVQ